MHTSKGAGAGGGAAHAPHQTNQVSHQPKAVARNPQMSAHNAQMGGKHPQAEAAEIALPRRDNRKARKSQANANAAWSPSEATLQTATVTRRKVAGMEVAA